MNVEDADSANEDDDYDEPPQFESHDNSGYNALSDIDSEGSDNDLEELVYQKTKNDLDEVLNPCYWAPRNHH